MLDTNNTWTRVGDIIIQKITKDKLPNNKNNLPLTQWISSEEAKNYGINQPAAPYNLGGLTGYKVISCGEMCGEEVYLESNDIIYRIDSGNYDRFTGVFAKILSTFKFIDPTADWKIYKNEIFGFEFQFPAEMTDKGYVIVNKDESIAFNIGRKWDQNAFTECMKIVKKETVYIAQVPFEKTTYVNDKNAFGGVCREVDESVLATIFFPLDESTRFDLVLHYSNKNQTQALDYLNQILSTFKFTNTEEPDVFPPLGWRKHSSVSDRYMLENDCIYVDTGTQQIKIENLTEYLKTYYKTNNLSSLSNNIQYNSDKYETFTVNSQGIGEIATVFMNSRNSKLKILAFYTNYGGQEVSINEKCQNLNFQDDIQKFVDSFSNTP